MSNNLDPQRIGQIGLHILSFEEMSKGAWKAEFKNLDEVNYALKDKDGFIARSPDDKEKIRNYLKERKLEIEEPTLLVSESPRLVVSGESIERGSPQVNLPHIVHQAPLARNSETYVQRGSMETIISDKGTFFHINSLRDRLRAFTDDEKLFMKACALAGVDIFTEYVSETAKKKIAKSIQDLTKGD